MRYNDDCIKCVKSGHKFSCKTRSEETLILNFCLYGCFCVTNHAKTYKIIIRQIIHDIDTMWHYCCYIYLELVKCNVLYILSHTIYVLTNPDKNNDLITKFQTFSQHLERSFQAAIFLAFVTRLKSICAIIFVSLKLIELIIRDLIFL